MTRLRMNRDGLHVFPENEFRVWFSIKEENEPVLGMLLNHQPQGLERETPPAIKSAMDQKAGIYGYVHLVRDERNKICEERLSINDWRFIALCASTSLREKIFVRLCGKEPYFRIAS